jgi:flagellar biosynthesis anti-sigma factor FlgM
MKIEVNSPTVSLPSVDRGAKKVSTSALGGAQDATQDTTTFHTDTLSVQSFTTQALNSPEVRQDRVDALSQAVKSGKYNVDSTKTADAILGNKEV